jgi:hypothetical protein
MLPVQAVSWELPPAACPHAFRSRRDMRMLKRMDELERFKEFLGPTARDYTNAELRQLQREMHAMAELLLDIYIYKRAGMDKGNSTRNFDTPEHSS